jgi:hypothetical protein
LCALHPAVFTMIHVLNPPTDAAETYAYASRMPARISRLKPELLKRPKKPSLAQWFK